MDGMDPHNDNTIDKIVLQVYMEPKGTDEEKQSRLKIQRAYLRNNRLVTDHETSLMNFLQYSFHDQIFSFSEVQGIRGINES